MVDNEHTAICVFTSRLRLPNAADWILKDITTYDMSVSGYRYSAICASTLSVMLSEYNVQLPGFVDLFESLTSPRQHRVVKISFNDADSWNLYFHGDVGKPSLVDRLSVAAGMIQAAVDLSIFVAQPNTVELDVWNSMLFGSSIKK